MSRVSPVFLIVTVGYGHQGPLRSGKQEADNDNGWMDFCYNERFHGMDILFKQVHTSAFASAAYSHATHLHIYFSILLFAVG